MRREGANQPTVGDLCAYFDDWQTTDDETDMRPRHPLTHHASLLIVAMMPPAHAISAAEATRPTITSRARLDIAIGDARRRPLTVGLYGEAAPASVALFERLVAGTLDTRDG